MVEQWTPWWSSGHRRCESERERDRVRLSQRETVVRRRLKVELEGWDCAAATSFRSGVYRF